MKTAISTPALLLIAFVVGLSSGLFLLPFWVGPFISAAKNGNPADWLGFAGNFGAGTMTLIAAIIAWFAVQQQIRAQELTAEHAREEGLSAREVQKAEAKFAARIVLTQPVHAAATVLNVVDQALGAADRMFRGGGQVGVGRALEFADKKEKLRSAMQLLKATMDHFAIAQAWQDLAIEDKANYLIVTSTLHTVMTIYENPPRIDDISTIRNQRDALTKLSTYLRAFDDELADVFDRDAKV